MKQVLRFVLYTIAWCVFPPLFLYKNRGFATLTTYQEITDVFMPSFARKRAKTLLRQGKFLSVLELFWSTWNPLITEETTRPLWRFCGGNRRPVFATLVVFTYSGVFLHWIGGGIGFWFRVTEMWMGGLEAITGYWVICSYMGVGVLVACAKIFRRARASKSR